MLYDLLNASYKRNKQAEQIGSRHGIQLDHNLSNSEHKVFVDPNTNNTNVVFTGTRKFGDLLTDGAVAMGLGSYTKRFKDSDKLIKDVKNKYPNTQITASGHSLGGTLSEHVKADKKFTYNKGVGIGDIGKKINKNQIDIRTKNDPVSFLTKTQSHQNNLINIKSRSLNPHSTDNLIKNRAKINI